MWRWFSLVVMLIVTPAQAQPPRAEPTRDVMAVQVLEADLAHLLAIFPGRWDNDLQHFFQKDLQIPEAERHNRVHSIFRPIEAPALGKHVFYVEQYSDNDPTKIYRQRIYVFSADAKEDAIRLEILIPKDAAALAGAWRDIGKLAALTPADLRATPGCEVFWRRQGENFIGRMKPGACRVQSERLKKTIIVSDDLVLSPREIWIADRATDETGAAVYGHPKGVPHKLRKARAFRCWVAVLRGAKHGDSGEGNRDWQFMRDLPIHDQGGELTVMTDETPARAFTLKLRAVEWPYGTNRPSLTLYVHEKGNERALSYAWGEENAERLGLNLRWLQASCTHEPTKIFE